MKMIKKRAIFKAYGHVLDHLGLALIDLRSGNTKSAETNIKLAEGIIVASREDEKKKLRDTDYRK